MLESGERTRRSGISGGGRDHQPCSSPTPGVTGRVLYRRKPENAGLRVLAEQNPRASPSWYGSTIPSLMREYHLHRLLTITPNSQGKIVRPWIGPRGFELH